MLRVSQIQIGPHAQTQEGLPQGIVFSLVILWSHRSVRIRAL